MIFIDSGGGATVDFSKHVAILNKDKNESITQGMKLEKITCVFTAYHDKPVDVEWESDNSLIIYYKYKESDIKKLPLNTKVNVKFKYKELN